MAIFLVGVRISLAALIICSLELFKAILHITGFVTLTNVASESLGALGDSFLYVICCKVDAFTLTFGSRVIYTNRLLFVCNIFNSESLGDRFSRLPFVEGESSTI